jgi:hypothetical protein
VKFLAGQRSFRVETSSGSLVSGPFFLPEGIDLNDIDPGQSVSFGGRIVSFSPTGTVAASGTGSVGLLKIINRSGGRIDVVVGTGGIVRQTPVYKTLTAPF